MSMNTGFPGGFPLGNPGLNRELHQVPFDILPSKGVPYPKNIEVLVAPIRIRERKIEKHTGSWFKAKVLCVRYAHVIPKAPAPKSIPFFQALWWAPLDWKRSWTNFLENKLVEWCV